MDAINLLKSLFPQYEEEIIRSILGTYKDVSICIDKFNDMEKEYDIALMTKYYKTRTNFQNIPKKNSENNYEDTYEDKDDTKLLDLNSDIVEMDDIKLSFKDRLLNIMPNRGNRYKKLKDVEMDTL